MKITGQHLVKLNIVDGLIKEPVGGAHRDTAKAIKDVGKAIKKELDALAKLGPDELKRQRRERFYAIGREGLG